MFKACNRSYFEIGDNVTQHSFAGCPAVVIEVVSLTGADSHYRVKVDGSGQPDILDENGEVMSDLTALISWEALARYNDAPDLVVAPAAEKAFVVIMRDCETKRVVYENRIEASNVDFAKRRAFEYAAQAGVDIDEVVVSVR